MKKSIVLALVLLMACDGSEDCTDTGVDPSTETDDTDDTDDTDTDPPVEEICNGEDDDGDGEVDEGFPDTDADGIADCVDEDCDVTAADPGDVSQDETCASEGAIPGAWALREEWVWSGPETRVGYNALAAAPVVGRVADTDGDRDVDMDDVPSVVFPSYKRPDPDRGYMMVLAGDDGRPLFEGNEVHARTSPALADVDGDDVLDVIARETYGNPMAMSGLGSVLWRASSPVPLYAPIDVADLDGDGAPEILSVGRLFDSGGTEIAEARAPLNNCWYTTTTADLDLDGTQEVLFGGRVSAVDGTYLWGSDAGNQCNGAFPLVLQADDDPEAEVLLVTQGSMRLHDHDGTVLANTVVGAYNPGAPCTGDFDGDGEIEIGLPSDRSLVVVELDGDVLWTDAGGGSRGACVSFDFDADGVDEIVSLGTPGGVRILDGATGVVLASHTLVRPTVSLAYPVVADVDADGAAEIVVPTAEGVVVLGHDGEGWAPAGQTWLSHGHTPSATDPDSQLRAPTSWWQTDGRVRAQTSPVARTADLAVEVTDSCMAGCEADSVLELVVQVRNEGWRDVPAGVPVAVYAQDGEAGTWLTTLTVDEAIPAGRAATGLDLVLSRDQLGPDGLVLVVDDDGSGLASVEDCDETDDRVVWVDPCE